MSVLPIVAIVEVVFQAKVAALLVTARCAVKTVPKSTTPLVGFLDVPLTFTAVTVPAFLVNPHPETVDELTAVAFAAMPSNLDLSAALIKPALDVVAAEPF